MTRFENSNEFLRNQLRMACDYLKMNLYLRTWTPGDGWTRFVLVDDEGQEVSRYLNRGELAEVLISVNKIFSRMHQIKLREFQELRAEQLRRTEAMALEADPLGHD